MGDFDPLLQCAVALAGQAAEAILAVRAAGFVVDQKADATPVTLADMRAEAIITAGLRAASPDIPVIAEEEFYAGRVTEGGALYWLVDPLDGTREFARGADEFAVCIGLVQNGRAILGVVASPALHEIHYGRLGHGAFKRAQGKEQKIAVRAAPPEGLTVFASRHYKDDPALKSLLAGMKIASLTNIGSALKFLRLAEGAADFYPRLGPTMEWDTAAPQAVLEAAGGATITAEGAALTYGKPGRKNPPFFAWGLQKP